MWSKTEQSSCSQRAVKKEWQRRESHATKLVGDNAVVSDFVIVWNIAHQAPLFMGFFKARILEWVGMPSFRGSSRLRNRTHVSQSPALEGRFFTTSTTWDNNTGLCQGCVSEELGVLWNVASTGATIFLVLQMHFHPFGNFCIWPECIWKVVFLTNDVP